MDAGARGGYTLAELTVVVAVVSTLAALAVTRVAGTARAAKVVAAESEMRALAAAFTDPAAGYLRDLGGIPGFSPAQMRLANLLTPTNVYGALPGAARPGGFRLDDGPGRAAPGCAVPSAFTRWNAEANRGWRGPYVRCAAGRFPPRDGVRFRDDATFGARGFYPELSGLRLPADVLAGRDGCSVYGFPGEPAVLDPWGNPYVLQVPPPQAFPEDAGGSNTNLPDEVRFRYARLVSAGPDGRLDTPCFTANATNWWATSWSERTRRLSRQAGLIDGGDRRARGDDLVLFLARSDVDEGER